MELYEINAGNIDLFISDCVSIKPTEEERKKDRIELPKQLLYWHRRRATTYLKLLNKEIEVKRIKAQKFLDVKNDADKTGKKLTVDAIDSIVTVDKDLLEAKQEEAMLATDVKKADGIIEAMNAKCQMLASLDK